MYYEILTYWVLLVYFSFTLSLIRQCFFLYLLFFCFIYFFFFKPKLFYQYLFESLPKQQLRGILQNIYVFNLINFTRLCSLLVSFINTQETFQCGLNVVVRLIWRRNVRQSQVNVETLLCMSTLKFTTLNNVNLALPISVLILTTLDNFEKLLVFSTSSFTTLIKTTLKQRCQYDHFQKVEKSKKIFLNFKKRWLFD